MTDERARELTLQVTRSFIVQAPAGSGKTELLIQRYLALLGSADLPEEVLAITFTRKAAAEMRQRVLSALTDAATGQAPETPHGATTHRLAAAALARSRMLEWAVELQPQRLRIETVDSLNAWLARRLSLLAGGTGAADLVEDPGSCYELAVARLLDSLGEATELGAALAGLLRAADNTPKRLERMLHDLLSTRDQWLPYLASGSDGELRATLESAARRLVGETLQRLQRHLPAGFADEVASILRDIAADRPDDDRYSVWRLGGAELRPAVEALDAWRTVPELLLTRAKEAAFRRSWAVPGTPAIRAPMRQRLRNLAATYAHDDGLRRVLLEIRELPEPRYSEHDWALVAALRMVLRQLVAELKVIFGERHCADFVEVALSAQQALGRVDEPSELLLALDRRLRHVLVDEFQDTSHTQFRLLRLLTSGWQPSDGRTLFLVGDPMQSIYRFRHADMSLFLKAQTAGVGDVALTPLILERNFRSAPGIVDWVNATFAAMFPAVDDMGAGIARFNACRATRPEEPGQRIYWHALKGGSPSAEVEHVAGILRDELRARPQASVGVLVRSRSHLIGLQETLDGLGIRARAVEVEAPNQKQVVQDLLGLTRALSHLADRVAWLGVLRAPWCGLGWSDLEALASVSSGSSVWAVIQSDELLANLTEDGRERVRRTRETLDRAFATRADRPFDRWVEKTWLALDGPASLEHDEDPQSVTAFFERLASVVDRGDVPDPAAIERHFLEPYGQGEVPRASGVDIMTIHRAKGLEFDTVVLLGLARRPRVEMQRGLYWHERTAADGREDFLLGAFADAANDVGSLTAFIRRADAGRDHAESMRLLYVATTRARERLHLVAQLGEESPRPQAGSLLTHLWAQAEPHFEAASRETDVAPRPDWITPLLRRLRTHRSPPRPREVDDVRGSGPEFQWVSHAAVQAGTVVHQILHEIAAEGLDTWTRERVDALRRRFRGRLALLGVEETELDAAVQRVVDAVVAILQDRRGRWLLSNHAEAASELTITLSTARGLEHLRIDRTFVDEAGLRWIVDYKTSQHTGGATETFLDAEAERYRSQLARYADAVAKLDDRPIRVGLYFPLLQAFRAWDPESSREDTPGPGV